MNKKENPPKHYRESFQRFYDDETNTYLSSYPLIWKPSDEIEKHFAKLYDVIVLYYADKYNWLNVLHLGFYAYLLAYARTNRAIVIEDFAARNKIGKHTLIAIADRLQDLELCERVMRPDHRGRPIDLVLRPPLAPSQLLKGEADRLQTRVNIGVTAETRRRLGKEFPGGDRRFSERMITTALKFATANNNLRPHQVAKLADDFHHFCLKTNHKSFRFRDAATDKERKDYYLQRVYHFCLSREIEYTEPIIEAALEIRRHYGREPFSL